MPTSQKTDETLDGGAEEQKAKKPATVRLAVFHPHDALVVDKDLTITTAGTDVPAGDVDRVRDLAEANDVLVREVK